jgi:hypothetical protein
LVSRGINNDDNVDDDDDDDERDERDERRTERNERWGGNDDDDVAVGIPRGDASTVVFSGWRWRLW